MLFAFVPLWIIYYSFDDNECKNNNKKKKYVKRNDKAKRKINETGKMLNNSKSLFSFSNGFDPILLLFCFLVVFFFTFGIIFLFNLREKKKTFLSSFFCLIC